MLCRPCGDSVFMYPVPVRCSFASRTSARGEAVGGSCGNSNFAIVDVAKVGYFTAAPQFLRIRSSGGINSSRIGIVKGCCQTGCARQVNRGRWSSFTTEVDRRRWVNERIGRPFYKGRRCATPTARSAAFCAPFLGPPWGRPKCCAAGVAAQHARCAARGGG
jgi:hypothetical protein